MKKAGNKKIILVVFGAFLGLSFSNQAIAETYIIDGKTFYMGKYQPQKKIQKEKTFEDRIKIVSTKNEIEGGLINEQNIQEVLPNVKTDKYPLELESGAHVTIGGVWTNASSREFKENIKIIESDLSLDTVLNLKPVIYNYKLQPGETYAGFIAEDVPDLVATSDRKSLSPMDIVSVVVGAIQKLWDTLIEILFRLDRIEEKLGIVKQNNIFNEKDNSEDIDNNQNSDDSVNDNESDNNGGVGNEDNDGSINDNDQDNNGDADLTGGDSDGDNIVDNADDSDENDSENSNEINSSDVSGDQVGDDDGDLVDSGANDSSESVDGGVDDNNEGDSDNSEDTNNPSDGSDDNNDLDSNSDNSNEIILSNNEGDNLDSNNQNDNSSDDDTSTSSASDFDDSNISDSTNTDDNNSTNNDSGDSNISDNNQGDGGVSNDNPATDPSAS